MKNKWLRFGVDKETLFVRAMLAAMTCIGLFIWRKKREVRYG